MKKIHSIVIFRDEDNGTLIHSIEGWNTNFRHEGVLRFFPPELIPSS
jgi:hypothetical protein